MKAGPNRKEIMGREVMEVCLSVCREQKVKTVNITGVTLEMNPHIYRSFLQVMDCVRGDESFDRAIRFLKN